MKNTLLNKIKNKEAKVGIIGLGYVGLPLAVEMARAGFETLGIDISEEKVNIINSGKNYIGDVNDKVLKDLVEKDLLKATTNFKKVKELDCMAICVPTPLDSHGQPELLYIKNSAKSIGQNLKKGALVVLESTTYPGTTEELLMPIIKEESKFNIEEFYLAYSPERVDPGNKDYKTNNTPKIVGGINKDSTEIATTFYRSVLDSEIHPVSSPTVAEMEKILENTYRFVNIALANEMALICHKMDINVWEVIDAAKTKPYGFQAFYPGPGLGGHCIPLDPYYLSWKAREYDYHTKLIEASGGINNLMPDWVVERASQVLNNDKKPLNGSNILLLGIAYKKDIDDLRMSPALKILEKLESFKAKVDYFDTFNPKFTAYDGVKRHTIEKLDKEIIKDYDLIIITTDHTNVDYELIAEYGKKIFDTRNALKDFKGDNIFRL